MIKLIKMLSVFQDNTYITVYYSGHILCSEYIKNISAKFKQKYGDYGISEMRALPDDHYMITII